MEHLEIIRQPRLHARQQLGHFSLEIRVSAFGHVHRPVCGRHIKMRAGMCGDVSASSPSSCELVRAIGELACFVFCQERVFGLSPFRVGSSCMSSGPGATLQGIPTPTKLTPVATRDARRSLSVPMWPVKKKAHDSFLASAPLTHPPTQLYNWAGWQNRPSAMDTGSELCIDMCFDKHIDTRIDKCIDMCILE